MVSEGPREGAASTSGSRGSARRGESGERRAESGAKSEESGRGGGANLVQPGALVALSLDGEMVVAMLVDLVNRVARRQQIVLVRDAWRGGV